MTTHKRKPTAGSFQVQETCKRGHSEWAVAADGKRQCLPCRRKRAAAWRERHPEKQRALSAAWVRANPDRVAATMKKSYHQNLTQHHSRGKLYRAVSRGEIVRPEFCGCGAEKPHAHHEDYSRPLDVMWLCRKCHDARHRELRKVASGE